MSNMIMFFFPKLPFALSDDPFYLPTRDPLDKASHLHLEIIALKNRMR
jgi:hypothetical protein